MNIFFRQYSTDIMKGKGKRSWKKFGMEQIARLYESYHIPDFDKCLKNISKYFTYTEFKKGEIILASRKEPDKALFLLQGSVLFSKTINGKIYTRLLMSEGNFVVKVEDVQLDTMSDSTIMALENCRMLAISKKDLNVSMDSVAKNLLKILTNFINEERLHFERKHSLLLYIDNQKKIDVLKENFPGIFERFKMKYISGFAGMKPETMSRVRGKTSTNDTENPVE